MKILILCTGNSCRSQMAQGFLASFDSRLEVNSAGTDPSQSVHPFAVKVMEESRLDISRNYPENVREYTGTSFDYVITVCDDANENCPVFSGTVKHRLHMGFEDPAKASGTEEQVLDIFRSVRDEIKVTFRRFYESELKDQLNHLSQN